MTESRDEAIYDAVCQIHQIDPFTSRDAAHVTRTRSAHWSAINARFPLSDENALGRVYDEQMFQREINDLPQEESPNASAPTSVSQESTGYETWNVEHDDEKLGDSVTFIELLGRGATSEVWRAESKHNQRAMAIKMVNSETFTDKVQVSLALAELQNLFRKTHPNIVEIFNAGKIRSPNGEVAPFVLMEYVPGKTLQDMVRDRGASQVTSPSLQRQAASIVATLARATHFLHDEANEDGKPIYHQDIKPANVLVHDGVPTLIDFGSLGLNLSLGQMGTREYMAPERVEANGRPTPGWDIFALGGVFYYLITGEHPLSTDRARLTPAAWAQWQATIDLEDPILTAICNKCLTFRPSDRYASAKDLADDLDDWLHDRPVVNISLDYSRWQRIKLLVTRCSRSRLSRNQHDSKRQFTRTVLLNVWKRIAQAFHANGAEIAWNDPDRDVAALWGIVLGSLAPPAILLSTLSSLLILCGISAWNANAWTAFPFVGAELIVFGLVLYWTRFSKALWKPVLMSVAITIAALAMRLLLVPHFVQGYVSADLQPDAEDRLADELTLVSLGLGTFTFGVASREWRMFTVTGVIAGLTALTIEFLLPERWAPVRDMLCGWNVALIYFAFWWSQRFLDRWGYLRATRYASSAIPS